MTFPFPYLKLGRDFGEILQVATSNSQAAVGDLLVLLQNATMGGDSETSTPPPELPVPAGYTSLHYVAAGETSQGNGAARSSWVTAQAQNISQSISNLRYLRVIRHTLGLPLRLDPISNNTPYPGNERPLAFVQLQVAAGSTSNTSDIPVSTMDGDPMSNFVANRLIESGGFPTQNRAVAVAYSIAPGNRFGLTNTPSWATATTREGGVYAITVDE